MLFAPVKNQTTSRPPAAPAPCSTPCSTRGRAPASVRRRRRARRTHHRRRRARARAVRSDRRGRRGAHDDEFGGAGADDAGEGEHALRCSSTAAASPRRPQTPPSAAAAAAAAAGGGAASSTRGRRPPRAGNCVCPIRRTGNSRAPPRRRRTEGPLIRWASCAGARDFAPSGRSGRGPLRPAGSSSSPHRTSTSRPSSCPPSSTALPPEAELAARDVRRTLVEAVVADRAPFHDITPRLTIRNSSRPDKGQARAGAARAASAAAAAASAAAAAAATAVAPSTTR